MYHTVRANTLGFVITTYRGKAVVVKKFDALPEPQVGDIVVSVNGVLFEQVRSHSELIALARKTEMLNPGRRKELTFLADQAFKKRFVDTILPSLVQAKQGRNAGCDGCPRSFSCRG